MVDWEKEGNGNDDDGNDVDGYIIPIHKKDQEIVSREDSVPTFQNEKILPSRNNDNVDNTGLLFNGRMNSSWSSKRQMKMTRKGSSKVTTKSPKEDIGKVTPISHDTNSIPSSTMKPLDPDEKINILPMVVDHHRKTQTSSRPSPRTNINKSIPSYTHRNDDDRKHQGVQVSTDDILDRLQNILQCRYICCLDPHQNIYSIAMSSDAHLPPFSTKDLEDDFGVTSYRGTSHYRSFVLDPQIVSKWGDDAPRGTTSHTADLSSGGTFLSHIRDDYGRHPPWIPIPPNIKKCINKHYIHVRKSFAYHCRTYHSILCETHSNTHTKKKKKIMGIMKYKSQVILKHRLSKERMDNYHLSKYVQEAWKNPGKEIRIQMENTSIAHVHQDNDNAIVRKEEYYDSPSSIPRKRKQRELDINEKVFGHKYSRIQVM